ncbi:MAG: sigma-54-dependent transcriptional regulator [Bacillota bacterium]
MHNKGRVLIIDDEEAILASLRFALEDQFDVAVARNAQEALRQVEGRLFDVCLIDLRLGSDDGLQLLKEVKQEQPDASLVVMTAYGSIRSAVECMRCGANDYVTKPLDIDELRAVLSQAVENSRLRQRLRRLDREIERNYGMAGIIGQSAAMKHVFDLIDKARWIDSNVLILGESGTGKELVARALHYTGKRKDGPFEAINCTAIPEALLESELFGYEKGAFTGALKRKPGRFELADGGTLFLDEIGDMDVALQAKILRVIEDRSVMPLGGTSARKIDVRIVAASNKDLRKEVERGNFREDLFYRLNVVTITLPPLRERKEDIPLLVRHFVATYAERFGKEIKGVTREAMQLLCQADYKGNVRELENVIERAVALKDPSDVPFIDVHDLPEEMQQLPHSQPQLHNALHIVFQPGETLAELERRAILETLRFTQGKRNLAAKLLGISERCLRDKLKQYRSHGTV